MHIQGARVFGVLGIPHPPEEILALQDFSSVLHQYLQQVYQSRGQLGFSSLATQSLVFQVEA